MGPVVIGPDVGPVVIGPVVIGPDVGPVVIGPVVIGPEVGPVVMGPVVIGPEVGPVVMGAVVWPGEVGAVVGTSHGTQTGSEFGTSVHLTQPNTIVIINPVGVSSMLTSVIKALDVILT